MLHSGRPLREKLVLFWHNHFATSVLKVKSPALMLQQNQLLRKHALGEFRPFLRDMGANPAMLLWLDSNQNVKGRANENYAREMMELFSLGVGHFSEKDVREAARAFTGWHTDEEQTTFAFNKDEHDDGAKTVLGQTGKWTGDDLATIVVDRPECALFLAGKLYREFISETDPPRALLEPLAKRFRASGGKIRDLVETMIRSRLFFSPHAFLQRIKSPVDFALGAVQAAWPGPASPAGLAFALEKMGQQLFAPPNVKGWQGGRAWLNTSTLLARNNFAEQVVMGNGRFPTRRLIRDDDSPLTPPDPNFDPSKKAPPPGKYQPTDLTHAFDVAARFKTMGPTRHADMSDQLLAVFLPGCATVNDRKQIGAFIEEGRPKGAFLASASARRRTPSCAAPSFNCAEFGPFRRTSMDRRTFLKSASLIAAGGAVVPEFLARAAETAKPGADRVLVVLEMTGGNDGLNMVVPHADDLYYKARPTLAVSKQRVLRIDDHVGLHPRLREMSELLNKKELAVVLGVGYPNPNRSHFESMDVWQSADPKRLLKTGWLGRSVLGLKAKGGFPAMHVAPTRLPLALQGAEGVVSLTDPTSFSLQFTGNREREGKRKNLLESLNASSSSEDLAAFVRRRQLQVFQGVEVVKKALEARPEKPVPEGVPVPPPQRFGPSGSLFDQLQLIAQLIGKNAGARIYYASIDGFDTHTSQGETHASLLNDLSSSISAFFNQLRESGQASRVVLLTYSEFGRRVRENGGRGTDHGAGSHLFLAGPSVKAGLVGKYPRLDDLSDGDLKFDIDFRRVYATLVDDWLGCSSKDVLGGTFEHLPLLAKS